VGGGFLYVAERDSRIEGGSDERVPQCVRADLLADSSAASDPADDPGGAVPVKPPPIRSEERRPADDRPGRPEPVNSTFGVGFAADF
jgi:hypothetical protein